MKGLFILYFSFVFAIAFGQDFSNLKFEKYSTNEGLSSSTCTEIYQDKDGFMWFGTIDGLNKYDGYAFKTYRPSVNDPHAISNNRILSITGDSRGNLWIGTSNGLNVFDRNREQFFHINLSNRQETGSNRSNVINDVLYDSKRDHIWVATNNGAYQIKLEASSAKDYDELEVRSYTQTPYSSNSLDNNEVSSILKDKQGNVWLATKGKYLNKYKPGINAFERTEVEIGDTYNLKHLPKILIEDFDGDFWIGNDLSKMVFWDRSKHVFSVKKIVDASVPIFNIYIDSKNIFWITTDGHGIYLYDKNKGVIEHIEHDEDDPFSLPNNQISSALEDNSGIYWLSTYNKGICKLVLAKSDFKHFFHKPGDENSLSSERAQAVLQDAKGRIWVGTDGGGLNLFDPETGSFKHFFAEANNSRGLSSDKITFLEKSYNGNIWVCTWDAGLNLFNPETNRCFRYDHDPKSENSIGDNSVWCAKEDKHKGLWVGTQTSGLNYLDHESNRFVHFKSNALDTSSIASNFVFSLFIDSKERLFVGTSVGLNMLSLDEVYSKDFTSVEFKLVENKNLQGHRINFITEDKRGNLWVGSDRGLHKLDSALNYLCFYTKNDGLPNDLVVGIQEDRHGYIWLTSRGGLTQFDPQTNKFVNFNVHDGVQGLEFQSKSIGVLQNGNIIAGGINGINIFNPKNFIGRTDSISSVITKISLFNKPVHVGDTINNRVLLTKPLSELEQVEFKYNERHVSFNFVALYYQSPERIQYAYRMKNIDDNFIISGSNRTANYSNLPPGEYEFQVKASLNSDWDSAAQTSVNIVILPPFWKSWWAYSLYFIVLSLVTWFGLMYYTKMVKEEKEHELDQMKLSFFINVAHEFRTPLTLILNPLDKILESVNLNEAKESAKTIQQSSHRLLNLVNQILDFRKVDEGKAEINQVTGDVVQFSKQVFDLFLDMACQKSIDYSFLSEIETLEVGFDPDKIEKILTNLLSNALKYTNSKGKVVLEINKSQTQLSANRYRLLKKPGLEVLEIKIVDTGIGFSKEHLNHVFKRFYKPDNTKAGTGIGLNYTKSLVDLLGGEINVESRLGEGTTITVLIPFFAKSDKKGLKPMEPGDYNFDQVAVQSVGYELDSESELGGEPVVEPEIQETANDRIKTILLVEDNKLLQAQVKKELEKEYRVLQSFNGADGLQMALRHYPDLVISDIMMPEMDGFELCAKLKDNFDTCHIPVILLTARSLDKDKIAGYKTGADDYIPKPFNMQVLKVRLRNLIASRIKLREKFDALGGLYISKEVTTNSTDEAFLDRATKVVVDHIDQSDFGLDVLLSELSVSRSTFFRKISSITGHSPTQFIRSIRLKYAAELLLKKDVPIKEIAYMSGFNSTSYFSKTFREHYGMTPNEYILKNS